MRSFGTFSENATRATEGSEARRCRAVERRLQQQRHQQQLTREQGRKPATRKQGRVESEARQRWECLLCGE
eukprot:3787772-Alexandrium_andersonii.AAC.1